MVMAVKGLTGPGASRPAPQLPHESAAGLLKRRYAAGEIDSAEFGLQRRELF